jgi:hypothetical protein
MSHSQSATKFDQVVTSVLKQLREDHWKQLSKAVNEVAVSNSLSKKKEIKKQLVAYLRSLSPVLKNSSKLSEEIRIEGNKIFKQVNANLFEACFLYSLALKCCETAEDFAFCHGNRSAALIKIGFNKVARDDCEQALKFKHPDPFKIYERLCSLSQKSVDQMRRNIAGLEKHLKKSSSKDIVQQYKTRLKAMERETYVEPELPDMGKMQLGDDGDKVKQ